MSFTYFAYEIKLKSNELVAGTYFPPDLFKNLLEKLVLLWKNEEGRVRSSGKSVIEQLRSISSPSLSTSVGFFYYLIVSKTNVHKDKQ